MAAEKTPLLVSSSESNREAGTKQGKSARVLSKLEGKAFVLIFSTIAIFFLFVNEHGKAAHSAWEERWESVDPHPTLMAGSVAIRRPSSNIPNDRACQGPLSGSFIPAAPLKSYVTPQAHPTSLVGSYEAVGLDANSCITYHDRYSLYTDKALGITYLSGSDEHHEIQLETPVLANTLNAHQTDRVDGEEWLRARVAKANLRADEQNFPDWKQLMDSCYAKRKIEYANSPAETKPETPRTALVFRMHEDHVWHEDAILNMRALISELSLNNPDSPYDIRILMEVHSSKSGLERKNVLSSSVPREFWGLVELWSEGEMSELYPDLPGKFMGRMSAQDHYRSTFMPLQRLALEHPEYDYIYNWEASTRYIGNYLDFFKGIEEYSRKEPNHPDMDKYRSWLVSNVSASQQQWDDDPTRREGRGGEADLITLTPIFDPVGSGWFWENDVQNYPDGAKTPRRASIGTNMRFSRAMLTAMHNDNLHAKKSMHCEAWPASLVLHSHPQHSHDQSNPLASQIPRPLKAVFAPHPVYFGHNYEEQELHSQLSSRDFYKKGSEKVMRDSSFWNLGDHAKEIHEGWMQRKDVCRSPVLLQLQSRR